MEASYETNNNSNNSDHLRKGLVVKGQDAVIAGSISGLLARLLTAPMDTVKIRYQLQVKTEHKYTNIVNTFRTIVREEGLLAFWKGNVPASILYVLYGSLQFTSYAYFNKLIDKNFQLSPQKHSWIVGTLAGTISSMVTYPFDVLRTRFVANRHHRRLRLMDTVMCIKHQEGFLGFFRGYLLSMVTVGASAGIIFGTYETLTIQSETFNIPWIGNCASTVAAVASKTITFPIDTIRRRMQVMDSSAIDTFTRHPNTYRSYRGSSFISIATRIIQQEGISSLYKGLSMALCKSAPSTIITLWTYERVLSLLSTQ
ncbi:HFR090Wp [Eremothecium sinecaudum]|uniref:HFR090Wp n=1 Tax=Eremothecium sinecaudum TaxID=45286 RepID=A0A120K2L8_9SACH|nr:HFR090Wp [Eremothecium sinecaudum]AMD21945.1 HFR090Wp [Eremothecium sinecaudum]